MLKTLSFWGCVVVVVVSFATGRAFATIDSSVQMLLGNPSGAIADTNNHDHYLIQRSVEALDYSDNLGQPVWASWDLTASDVGTNARSTTFFTDTNLPPNFYRVTDNDYNGVGAINFARGHLCPSEDRTDTRTDNDLVFLMSNIMPQNAVNNSGVWAQFENYCRSLLATNELLITCGPSGFGTNRIPSGKAIIADYTWKIVVIVPTNSGPALGRITSSTRVIALKIPNNDSATNTWPNYVVAANQIQVDTGFTFFTTLAPDIADTLRNKVDGQTNPSPEIFALSATNGSPGTEVIISGTNFSGATAVAFGGVGASFFVDSDTQITATVASNSNSGFISVTTPSGTAISTNSFAVLNNGGVVFNGVLVGWDMSTQTGGLNNFGVSPLPPTTNAANLVITKLTRGDGVKQSGTGAAGGWGGTGWTNLTASSAIASNTFVTFGVAATDGYKVSFTTIARFDYRRSSSGPTNGVLQYQVGASPFVDITNFTYSSTSGGATNLSIDLSGIVALQNVGANTNIIFRIVNYNAGSSSGTWYIYDVAGSAASDLAIQGTVAQILATNAPALVPTVSTVSHANNQFQFTINGTTGSNYVVEATTNLMSGNWISLTTNAAPFLFIESNADSFGQRFYRVQIAP